MTKAALHFDLSDEEDRELYGLASAIISRDGWTDPMMVRHACHMWRLLDAIGDHLRSRGKYGEDVDPSEHRLIETLRHMMADTGFHGWEEDGPVDRNSGAIDLPAGEYSVVYYPVENRYGIWKEMTRVELSAQEMERLLDGLWYERYPEDKPA